MKYVNAMEILPKELISEIQKYVEGNIISVETIKKIIYSN